MKLAMLDMLHMQLFGNDFLTNYGVSLEIDTNPSGSPNYVPLGDGFTNITEAMNDVVQQYQFLNNNGYGQTYVTGQQPMMTLTGVRKREDEAQNFIFDKKYKLLQDRETNLRFSYLNGVGNTVTVLWNNVTLVNPQEFSGASEEGSAVSIEIHTSGEPVVTGADLIGLLSVVSVAGTSAGDTQIYVNPALGGGNIYKYLVGPAVVLPTYGQDVSAYTTWNGTDEITAATGQEILIVEATAGNLARKAGKQTVTSA